MYTGSLLNNILHVFVNMHVPIENRKTDPDCVRMRRSDHDEDYGIRRLTWVSFCRLS